MGKIGLLGLIAKPVVILLFIIIVLFTATVLLVLFTSIHVRKEVSTHTIQHLTQLPPEAWERLAQKTIFFGHKSVGYNILDGIQDLAAHYEALNLNVVKTNDANQIETPMLAHFPAGRNFDPESKIAAFTAIMDSGVGEKVDIAFFKLCFVDIGISSNPENVLASYCEAMENLKARFPHVKFIHVTVPLCGPPNTIKGKLKATVKRLIGRPPVLDENQIRAQYNTLLRKRFAEKEPLFDLALYETIGPDGMRYYSIKDGQEIPILVRSYTDDGGHLNVAGRQHVAEQMLLLLMDLAKDT